MLMQRSPVGCINFVADTMIEQDMADPTGVSFAQRRNIIALHNLVWAKLKSREGALARCGKQQCLGIPRAISKSRRSLIPQLRQSMRRLLGCRDRTFKTISDLVQTLIVGGEADDRYPQARHL